MRILRVRAHDFGKLSGALDLAPGLTVVHGENEAGKSTWLQAIFAGLCGRRRGRGANTSEAREFERQYEPWNGEPWRATVRFQLDDRRLVEIQQQDLKTKESEARDADTGRKIGHELIYRGSIDGSRFLGLNRQVMPSTLVIAQGDIQRLRQKKGDEASALREELQRAAASAGGAATAVQALRLLKDYARDQIGPERRNSTKPLQRAIDRAAQARRALEAGRDGRRRRTRLENDLSAARDWARGATAQVRTCERLLAERELERLDTRLAEIDRLAPEFPESASPPAPGEEPDAAAAREVSVAAEEYRWRPEAPMESDGPGADELAKQLADMPEAPDGDAEVAAEVAGAARQWRAAAEARTLREQLGPGEPPTTVISKADEPAARRALEVLELPPPEPLEEAERRVQALRDEQARRRRQLEASSGFGRWPWIGGVVGSLLVALGFFDLLPRAVGVAGALLAFVCSLLIYRAQKRLPHQPGALEQAQWGMDKADAEADLRDLKRKNRQRERRIESARQELESLGLEAGADAVRRAIAALRERDNWDREQTLWQSRVDAARKAEAAAESTLRATLGARGMEDPGASAASLLERYERRCRRNAELAHDTSQREALASRLEARRRTEKIRATREASERRFRAALEVVGYTGDTDEEAELWAGRWLQDRERRLRELRSDWDLLQRLLDGQDRSTLAVQRDAAVELVERTSESEPDAARELQELDDAALERKLTEARTDAFNARIEVSRHEVQLDETDLSVLAELEEEQSAAEQEVAFLRRAADVLQTAQEHLAAAQDEVHRMLAPDLREALAERLSLVTAGRYSDVRIDPEEGLEVQLEVEEGVYRSASELSHGTVDQVYLLLRIALAEALGDRTESAPLFLDDATVHCDTDRTMRFLDLLLALSRERQIVVFSQEEEVRGWASERLAAQPRHRLIELDRNGLPASDTGDGEPQAGSAPSADSDQQHSLL